MRRRCASSVSCTDRVFGELRSRAASSTLDAAQGALGKCVESEFGARK